MPDGINYSLASRDMIASMIEIQANATPFHAGIYIASCDKGLPGNMMECRKGVPRLYAEHAVSPMKGAYMDLDA